MGIVTDILASLDRLVSNVGQRLFESTAAALGPLGTIMVTLLSVPIGINMAIGAYDVSMRDAVQLIWRIVLVHVFHLISRLPPSTGRRSPAQIPLRVSTVRSSGGSTSSAPFPNDKGSSALSAL